MEQNSEKILNDPQHKESNEKEESITPNTFHMIIILQLTPDLESRTYYHYSNLDDALTSMNALFYEVNNLVNDSKSQYSPSNPAPWKEVEAFFQGLPDFAAFIIDPTIGGYRSLNQTWLCNELYQYLYSATES